MRKGHVLSGHDAPQHAAVAVSYVADLGRIVQFHGEQRADGRRSAMAATEPQVIAQPLGSSPCRAAIAHANPVRPAVPAGVTTAALPLPGVTCARRAVAQTRPPSVPRASLANCTGAHALRCTSLRSVRYRSPPRSTAIPAAGSLKTEPLQVPPTTLQLRCQRLAALLLCSQRSAAWPPCQLLRSVARRPQWRPCSSSSGRLRCNAAPSELA